MNMILTTLWRTFARPCRSGYRGWIPPLPLLLGGCLLLALNARADGLPAPMRQALQAAQIPAANVAVVVQGLDAAAPRITHNAREAMNPASVMKLLTTYAALDLLGPAYTWKTTLWTESATVDGVLPGNLYLQGSGDPRFAIEHAWALLRQARVRGIRRITGDIVLDRSVFPTPAGDPGAFDDKPMRPYNVGPDGLLLNLRALRFTLQADPARPRLLLETPSDGLRVDNQLQAGDGDCRSNWKDQILVRLLPEAAGQRLEFSGSYATACGEKGLNLAPLTAELQAEGLLRALWRELGGSLDGRVRSGSVPGAARLLARHESPPLAEIVRDINKYSNNVMARQVFLTLGADNAPASPERARQRIGDWLNERRLHFPELILDNGSGLSRRERLSATSLNRLLLDAWRHPAMPEFIASLPIVGIDGTMQRRLTRSPASGQAHLKTGTLDGVKSVAGYVLDRQGRRHALTVLINHPNAAAGSAAIDSSRKCRDCGSTPTVGSSSSSSRGWPSRPMARFRRRRRPPDSCSARLPTTCSRRAKAMAAVHCAVCSARPRPSTPAKKARFSATVSIG